MEDKEFNLSEKMISTRFEECIDGYFRIDSVREFIRLLKQHLTHSILPGGVDERAAKLFYLKVIEPIDKLAGLELQTGDKLNCEKSTN